MAQISKLLTHIPTPSSLSYFWNMGSILGLMMAFQVVTGLFLSFHYESSIDCAFSSVVSMMFDKNSGWLVRSFHSNGASMIFILMYIHLGRGLYYGSFVLRHVWSVGVTILLACMSAAFLGYVLPWGQMSYWGATVITNLLSAVPYWGADLVSWLWGGFSVEKPTLIRFFSFHFLVPFVILVFIAIHVMALHSTGSSNPLGLSSDYDKVYFSPLFVVKDLLGFVAAFVPFTFVCIVWPDLFMDSDNFMRANPMNTPPHIQPEWYFLFAYAILRSVPSKLGGVVSLVSSIAVMYMFALKSQNLLGSRFSPVFKTICWVFFTNFTILTWLGMMPVEEPFVSLSKASSALYFLLVATMIAL